MKKEEIIDLALRYIDEGDIVDFPDKDELFCFVSREIPEDRILEDDEAWAFSGYGLCSGYEKDYESKPAGKWIWFNYLSLNSFPPTPEVTKLQPPHIAKGSFTNPSRTTEIKILKMMPDALLERATNDVKKSLKSDSNSDNLIPFPKK